MNFIFILVLTCLLVQAAYWHLIFNRAADSITPATRLDHANPFLSVVICFHKTWKEVPEVLHSLENQSYQHFEVILVNDGPVEMEPQIVQDHIHNTPSIRYIEHQKMFPGKKGALTTGIEAASGDWIILTDFDCRPGPFWLETMLSYIPDKGAILLGYSPYGATNGFLNFVIQQETLLTAFQYLGWARKGHAYMGVGRNMAYHKEIFQNVTFDSHSHIPMGDDDLFVNEAAHHYPVVICNEKDSFVYSDPVTSWKAWYRQKTRHKSGGKHYSKSSKFRLALFVLALLTEKIVLLLLLFVRIDIFLILVALKMVLTAKPLQKLYSQFDQSNNFWKMWIYEWFHVIYLILVAPYIFFKTKKEWV